jgi:spermidine/putrescine transport system substrate-binding protein
VLTALVFTLVPALTFAAPPIQAEGKVYTVQKDDWLSKLADKEYGDLLAFPAIVYHTNQKAATDKTFTFIENPDVIEVGWTIYLPTPEEAEAYLTEGMEALPSPTAGLQEYGGKLNILGWEGYDDPGVFEPFYDATGVVANSTYIGNNDEVISKFKAGGPGVYDVGDINSRYLKPMIEQGMLMPLDESKLPNLEDVLPAFAELDFGRGPDGKLYAVPAYFGFSTLCYRADLVPEPPDWNFWQLDTYKGRYAVTTNPLASMYIWGMVLDKGQDASKWTQDDLAEIKAYGLAHWKDAATTAASLGEQTDLLVRGDAVVTTDCFEFIANEARKQGVDVKSFLPGGKVKPWVDVYFIFTGAQNVDAAHAWINYSISPQPMAELAANLGTAVGNSKAYSLMDRDLVKLLGYGTLNQAVKNAEFNVLPDADAQPPYVTIDDMYKAFDEIKASAE